jgi:paired amphipathic helix protein Sin3a
LQSHRLTHCSFVQREWNKLWRETDAKNFYRALDYQGATFKSNDRRIIVPKALVSEIENLYNDQIDAREKESESENSPGAINRPNYQLSYSMTDKAIFKDITRVVFSFLDRQGGSDNKSDRGKIRTFMKTFIPLCYGVQDVVPENLLREDDDDDEDDEPMDDDDETRSVNSYESDGDVSRSPSSRKRGKRGRSARRDDDGGPSDLLRDVLTRKTKESSHTRSRSGSPSGDEAVVKNEDTEGDAEKKPNSTKADAETNDKAAEETKTEDQDKPKAEENGTDDVPMDTVNNEDNSILAQAAAATAPIARKRTVFSFFCNNSFYVFFRQYQVRERFSNVDGCSLISYSLTSY